MNENLTKIGKEKLIAIIREKTSEHAFYAAQACIEGGIKIVEITMNTPSPTTIINKLSEKYPHILMGAGTVLDTNMAKEAVDSGAKFIVSPHTDPDIIKFCKDQDIVVAPGTTTPSEMMYADKLGADIIKVFPIDNLGGPSYIKNVRGPLPHLKLMPTGGVNITNIKDFLHMGVFAVGLSRALIVPEAIATSDYDMIKRLAQAIIKKAVFK